MKSIISCLILLLTQSTFAQMKPANVASVYDSLAGATVEIKEPPIDSTVIKAIALPAKNHGNSTKIFADDTGCSRQYAMSQSEFSVMMATINVNQTDEARLLESFRHARKSCLNSAQIAQICTSFLLEKTRLEFAKFAYSTCVDPKNYSKVAELLTKKSYLDDLRWYIAGK